jgi:hypothetical protein
MAKGDASLRGEASQIIINARISSSESDPCFAAFYRRNCV